MDQRILIDLAWVLAGVILLAAVGFVVLRFIALRIARRVSEAAEDRIAATLQHGIRAIGIGGRAASPAPPLDASIAQIDRLARMMDRLIPLPLVGGVGFDALLGLIPGVGDALGFAISSFIVIRAARLGASSALISRLIAIQCIDLLIGAVPVVGDIFDMAYQADVRSAALIREAFKTHDPSTRGAHR